MKITQLEIRNFKSIKRMQIGDIQNALILVGRNNTGKTVVLEAIRALTGLYVIRPEDFGSNKANIEIDVRLELAAADLEFFKKQGTISTYRSMEAWYRKFREAFPSFEAAAETIEGGGTLSFTFIANREGGIRYDDGSRKNNTRIPLILPHIYYLDTQRNPDRVQEELLLLQEDDLLKQMRAGCCMFNTARKCNNCFSCIGLINKKTPEALNAFETAKLLDYKLYQLNLDAFSREVNENYHRNGGLETLCFSMNRDPGSMLAVTAEIVSETDGSRKTIDNLGKGMRSVYLLSLLETCAQAKDPHPGIILIEEPELFLHPQLQKVSGDILYRLAQKNQVIFSTHSPNLLANFNRRQIRQIVLDEEGWSDVRPHTSISQILNDLGYSAGDLMNVDFVFIVEGRQDKSRLPLLLQKYYSEIYDEDGNLSRVAIITTNSCTNIKTYANLKYINQIYLKDNFLMIRDGDGRDAKELRDSLCRYYEERDRADIDGLPRVTEKNVLILKYYSFENYFFNPAIMVQIGVVESEETFYQTLFTKWKEYLCRLSSGKKLTEAIGHDFASPEDMRDHMEDIRIHLRGHNLFDLFYGRYRRNEREILQAYIEAAPRSDFADIFEAIDRFIYFENRKNGE